MNSGRLVSFETEITRLGTVLEPNGDVAECEGVLNPACIRTRDGELLIYPRLVGPGNTSRVGLVRAVERAGTLTYERIGCAIEPEAPYELRDAPGGYGCEDPRVTFIPALDLFVMAYTAYGPAGPRIVLAVSHDAYEWRRLGLVDFSHPGLPSGDDKDAAFFPEPVRSPSGQLCFAMYHRPMLHISAVDGVAAVSIILDKAPTDRESTRIAYIPVEPALAKLENLLTVTESELVLCPEGAWGRIKTGAGTPPVRIDEGWLSLFHAVDAVPADAQGYRMRYSAGLVVHDYERPHIVRYRSPSALFHPETPEELRGAVNNVVFPTGIDPQRGQGGRGFDIYYGMADSKIGRVSLRCGASAAAAAEESAA